MFVLHFKTLVFIKRYRKVVSVRTLKVFTSMGKVALKSMTWRSLGWNESSCSMTGVNSGDSNLSASSMTKVGHSERSATPLLARSSTLPGVPTRIWTASFNRIMSSINPVPPVVTMTLIPRCFPSVLQTWDVWSANSRVGTRRRAWVFVLLGLIRSKVGITKAAVLPVPFFARARISLPVRATGIVSSWMGDGFSKPASKIPIISSRLI